MSIFKKVVMLVIVAAVAVNSVPVEHAEEADVEELETRAADQFACEDKDTLYGNSGDFMDDVESFEECKQECVKKAGCKSFSYLEKPGIWSKRTFRWVPKKVKKCFFNTRGFHNGDGGKHAGIQWIGVRSGNIKCDPQYNNGYSCKEDNIIYGPGNKVGPTVLEGVASFEECKKKCKNQVGCKSVVYVNGKSASPKNAVYGYDSTKDKYDYLYIGKEKNCYLLEDQYTNLTQERYPRWFDSTPVGWMSGNMLENC